MWWRWWWCWRKENNRNVLVVVVVVVVVVLGEENIEFCGLKTYINAQHFSTLAEKIVWKGT